MRCPHCHQEISATDRFCPHCTERLVSTVPPASAGDFPSAAEAIQGLLPIPEVFAGNRSSLPSSQSEASTPSIPGVLSAKIDQLSGILQGMTTDHSSSVRQDTSGITVSPSGSGIRPPSSLSSSNVKRDATIVDQADDLCLSRFPVRVDYAINRYILARSATGSGVATGHRNPVNLELRIHCQSGDLDSVQAWFVISAGREQEVLHLGRPWDHHGQTFSNILPYDLQWDIDGGDLLVDCFLLCHFKDRTEYYTFHVKHAIMTPGLTGQQIINNFNITAGDGSVIKEVGLHSTVGNGDHLIVSLNQEPPCFRSMAFRETEWRPEDFLLDKSNLYSRHACDKLTLEFGETLIHLCSKEEIRVGRSFNRNDIALNDWTNDSTFSGLPTATVSHCHGVFRNLRNHVAYRDTSSYGTRIHVGSGHYLIHKGSSTGDHCKLPSSCGISFGDLSMQSEILTCVGPKRDALCLNCRHEKCRGMILRRTDSLPEFFLFIWECCELDVISPDLSHTVIYRRNGGFLLKTADGRLLNLVPEMTIPLANGKCIKVSRFFQPCY